MRLIDADALTEEIDSWGCNDYDKYDLIDAINNAPTVEFPEQITIKCDTEEDKQKLLSAFRNAKLKAIVEEERPQGEWEDYSGDFYKCPECGYLLNKLCPQCHNKVFLPKGDADMRGGRE